MENAIRFRDLIRRGEIPLGTIVSFNDPAITEALCRDLDFIWIDAEHGAMTLAIIQSHIMALKGIDLDVNEGEIVALIGSNGAGKSTLMMTICGVQRAREGTIVYAGRDITRHATHEIARLKKEKLRLKDELAGHVTH